MRNFTCISLLVLASIATFAQEKRKPFVTPLLGFEVGFSDNSAINMSRLVEEYTNVPKSVNPLIRIGVSAGVFIGDRHRVALTYNTAASSGHSGMFNSECYSSGLWYQFRVLKDRPFFVQFGYTETVMTLYIANSDASPTVGNDGTLSQYLNDNSSYNLVGFEQSAGGINLAVSYEIIGTPQVSISGQLGYQLNYGYGRWQYIERYNNAGQYNTALPKDSLSGLFLKLILQVDFVNAFKSKQKI